MKHRIAFTYDCVDTESCEQGDTCDNGFYVDGWKYSMNDPETYKDIMENKGDYDFKHGLADALRKAKELGITEFSGSWWSTVDSIIEGSSTDENWNYSLHVENITPSTQARITRALNN